jgi:hypothetical protein
MEAVATLIMGVLAIALFAFIIIARIKAEEETDF